MNNCMKVYVFGIDALEYNLVEKLDLKNLKQSEYGKSIVPIDEKSGRPVSPQVWGSFLTGDIEKKGFAHKSIYWKMVDKFKKKRSKKFKEKIAPLVYKIGSIAGEKTKDFPKLDKTTFLDETKSVKLNVPYYDYSAGESLRQIEAFRRRELGIQRFKELQEEEFDKLKNKTLEKIKEECDIFMVYYDFLDNISHILYKDSDYIEKKYTEVDEFIGKIKSNLKEDEMFLIVSDHGFDFEKGEHSNHGFYSLNKKFGLQKPKIIDFYDIILKKLKLPTKKDRVEIKRKLQDLGYI